MCQCDAYNTIDAQEKHRENTHKPSDCAVRLKRVGVRYGVQDTSHSISYHKQAVGLGAPGRQQASPRNDQRNWDTLQVVHYNPLPPDVSLLESLYFRIILLAYL